MKNSKRLLQVLLAIFVLSFSSCKKEEAIEEGKIYAYDISLYSQAEVNDFAKNKYAGIAGDLVIIGSDISYLDSLYTLKFVKGIVQIGNTSLINTFGLDQLTSIAKNETPRSATNLFIYDNAVLATINFPFVNEFRGSFTIRDNADLFGVYMPKIPYTEDLIKLENNPELIDLNFNALKFIGGTLWIKNTGLENLSGFSAVISMQDTTPISGGHYDAGLHISNNDNLKNLAGLSGLLKIGGDCIISNNPQLKDMSALLFASAIEHGLSITYNNSLEDLEGLKNISSIGAGIVISHNSSLTDLCGLNSCYDDAAGFTADWNAYNPTYQDMEDGNCSQ